MRLKNVFSLALVAACSTGAPTETFEFLGRPDRLATIDPLVLDAALARTLVAEELVERISAYPSTGLGEELAEVVTNNRAFYVRPNGEIVPSHALKTIERARNYERFGKLTPILYETQAELTADETVNVYIFVNGSYLMPELPIDGTDLSTSASDYEEWITDNLAQQAEQIQLAKTTLISELGDAATLGTELVNLPLLQATVPVSLLRSQALNSSPSVLRVIEADTVYALNGYAAQASMNVPAFTGGICGVGGCSGAGLPVGIWEHDPLSSIQSAINTSNSRLNHGGSGSSYLFAPTSCTTDAQCPSTVSGGIILNKRKCTASRCVEEHLTYVAGSMGMIGSFNYSQDVGPPNAPVGDQFGSSGAWDVKYRVGNDNDPPGLDYILGQNAVWINRSASMVQVARLASEFAGQYDGAHIITAGGNDGAGYTTQCSRFRNGLCVGGYFYDPYASISSHHWWGYSNDQNEATFPERPHLLGPASHVNGISSASGLALPEIAASGTSAMRYGDYNTGGIPQGISITGSSFASPAVLAPSLLAFQYEGLFSYLAYPQVNKAVMMAGTVDSNLDGAIGLTTNWSTTPDAKDGAGHIDMAKVKATLDANQYFFRDFSNSDFVSCGAGCREYVVVSNVALTNKQAKVALVWSACSLADDGFTDAQLVNDLDLAVSRTCAGSTSTTVSNTITSETEMVQVGCSLQVGTFTVKVRIKNGASLQPCGLRTTERVGVAWSVR